MAVSTRSTEPTERRRPRRPRCDPAPGERRPPDLREFERRYEAMPEVKKAELIEGEVYMPSPVRHGAQSPAYPAGYLVGKL